MSSGRRRSLSGCVYGATLPTYLAASRRRLASGSRRMSPNFRPLGLLRGYAKRKQIGTAPIQTCCQVHQG